MDRLCFLCNGTGEVNTEHICECGRPAIKQAGNELVCYSTVCKEKSLARQLGSTKKKEIDPDTCGVIRYPFGPIGPKSHNSQWITEDDDDWEERFADMMTNVY